MNKKKLFRIAIVFLVLIVLSVAIFFIVKKPKKNKDKLVKQETPVENTENLKEEPIRKKGQLDPLLRNNKWGITKEVVKKGEEKQHSKLYREEEDFIIYQDVSALNDDYLLTYLFKDNQLKGILYELEVANNDRSDLAERHQKINDLLNRNYANEKYEVEVYDEWITKDRNYASNVWNKGVVDGELELKTAWTLDDYRVILKTSKQSDFDFLFTKSNEILDANLYILLTPEKDTRGLMDIRPTLTQEQTDKKEGKVDLFEDSINEDNLNKEVANKRSDVDILRFNKAKQYVVITNNAEEPINLTGWYMTTQNKNNTFYFEDGLIIKPKEQILVYAADGKNEIKKGISRDYR